MVHQSSRRRTRSINSQYLPRSVFISTRISTTMLLAIFDISKTVENGVGITPSLTLHQDHIHVRIYLWVAVFLHRHLDQSHYSYFTSQGKNCGATYRDILHCHWNDSRYTFSYEKRISVLPIGHDRAPLPFKALRMLTPSTTSPSAPISVSYDYIVPSLAKFSLQ